MFFIKNAFRVGWKNGKSVLFVGRLFDPRIKLSFLLIYRNKRKIIRKIYKSILTVKKEIV